MSIIVDSITYDIPFTVLGRKADMLFKFAERTVNGKLRGETIGTYYNFDLQMGQSLNNSADYAALWVTITDPNFEHEITMPDGENGTITFDCYFASMSDDVKKWYSSGVTYYRELRFSVIAINPARTP